jgi:hypothetical protein
MNISMVGGSCTCYLSVNKHVEAKTYKLNKRARKIFVPTVKNEIEKSRQVENLETDRY